MKIKQHNERLSKTQSSIKKSNLFQQRWLIAAAGYGLMLSGATLALSACQSSNMLAQSANPSDAMIDFSVANPDESRSQSQAFRENIKADNERYQQLFDEDKYPSSEQQAKQHLLNAIRQHMSSDQVAVAQARFNVAPFIDAGSIDAGSTSLLRTILEVYSYLEDNDSDDASSDYDDCNHYNYDEAAEATEVDELSAMENVEDYDESDRVYSTDSAAETAAAAAVAAACDAASAAASAYSENGYENDSYERASDAVADADEVVVVEPAYDYDFVVAYSKDGYDYDEEGYDYDGYDENGYDRSGYDYDGYDENGYDANGYDYDGYDEYGVYGYQEEGYNEDDYDYGDESDSSVRSRIANSSPKVFMSYYEDMQAAKIAKQQAENSSATEPQNANYPGAISQVLNMLHKTSEQVAAANAYQYKYLSFNSVSQYQPKLRQFQIVYSYDYIAPTISSSVQIPLALDFNNSRISVDPSALMPIIALVNPEYTPLPQQTMSHTVDFGMPKALTSQLPAAVLYDAAINAMQDSMAELSAENFTALDIRGDDFAKQVGATRAIKINFGSKQGGEMIGKMLKHMSQSLQQYVDVNPTKYPDGAALKTAIAKLQLYNKGYQSGDVGSLLQIIEAVAPISFNQSNYYYLDSSDRLLAKQQRVNLGSDLIGTQNAMINQIRYDRSSFNRHTLTPLLAQSFGANAKAAIDGDAWLADQRAQEDRLDSARFARYDYEDADDVAEMDSTEAPEFDTDTDSYSEDYGSR